MRCGVDRANGVAWNRSCVSISCATKNSGKPLKHAKHLHPSEIPEEPEDEEYDLPTSSSNAMQFSQPSTQLPAMEEIADEVAQMEDAELQALLEFMPVDEEDRTDAQVQGNLWSDDDEYDELFSEFMEQDQASNPPQARDHGTEARGLEEEDEAMDMS